MKRLMTMALLCLLLCLLTVGVSAKMPMIEGQVLGHGAYLDEVDLLETAERHTEEDIRTTAKGLQFLKEHEGFVPGGMDDNTQTSIGYGTSVTLAAKYGFSTTSLTEEEAHKLLVCVVWEFEQDLNAFLETNNVVVTDEQYDALVSFTYNLGPGWMAGCRFSRALISGSYEPNFFASAMGIWCHVGKDIIPGLVNRRIDEITLFLYGIYDEPVPRFCTLIYQGEGWIDNDIEFFLKGEPYGGFTLTEPPSEGMVFDGWYTEDSVLITADTIVEESHVVTVRWREIVGYEILALTAENESGKELEGIPEDGFYLSADVYKASGTGQSVLVLATYSEEGKMLDIYFLRAKLPAGTSYSMGVWIDNESGEVGECRAFVMSSLGSAETLCPMVTLK